ncbi:MAG: alpha-L-fucosidase [Victivallales bacterium]|nr:alpha-L-fucosidase [Victivallales bacterium]
MGENTVGEWFSSRRLGLFIHFGLYAIDAWHEQAQMRRRVPRREYEGLASRFNPDKFDAEAIVRKALELGMEYLCITAKHHDGFCLWATKHTDYNVMNTPYKKDIIGQVADACHRHGLAFGIYYSVVDWHHPNYPNEGRHHELPCPGPDDRPDWDKYMSYLEGQVTELCSNYGEVRHFFWDMNVPGFFDPSVNESLRRLQPGMVINDRGFDPGDFGTPEREYDRDAGSRHSKFGRPAEACNSVGMQSWGYRGDEDYYLPQFLIRSIAMFMSKGAHYLLNVGPAPDGTLPKEACQILDQIGSWYVRTMEAYSDTTPCSQLTSNGDVMLTRRGSTLYVHVIPPVKSGSVTLPPLSDMPQEAVLLNTGQALECSSETLPSFWETGKPVLRIRGLPAGLTASGETMVVRLSFANPSVFNQTGISEFVG